MARWRLQHVALITTVLTYSSMLSLLGLDVVGFTTSPLGVGKATSSHQPRAGACSLSARQGGFSSKENRIDHGDESVVGASCSRTGLLRSLGAIGSAVIWGQLLTERAEAASFKEELPTVGKITKSGVKYFEYRVGEGVTPRWGQDCIVRYVMYGRAAPDKKLMKIDSSDNNKETYLFKHGNGRQIKGMEEGIHSMRIGGKRRIIIPQDLGYTVQGLGPYPADARRRDVLVQVLTSFEGQKKGELVMDVELLEAFDDEADQGYYEDEAVTAEQLQEIVQETGRFSGGMPFEQLPGQVSIPKGSGNDVPSKDPTRLPGELGKELVGSD